MKALSYREIAGQFRIDPDLEARIKSVVEWPATVYWFMMDAAKKALRDGEKEVIEYAIEKGLTEDEGHRLYETVKGVSPTQHGEGFEKPPIPEVLYHVTPYPEKILAGGFKTSKELGISGFGGHGTYVSFTSDYDEALQYQEGLKVLVRVMRGDMTLDKLREWVIKRTGSDKAFIGPIRNYVFNKFLAKKDDAGARKILDDPDPSRYLDQNDRKAMWEVMNYGHSFTGIEDASMPLFMGQPEEFEHLVNVDPENVKILGVEVRRDPRYYEYNPSEKEFRIFDPADVQKIWVEALSYREMTKKAEVDLDIAERSQFMSPAGEVYEIGRDTHDEWTWDMFNVGKKHEPSNPETYRRLKKWRDRYKRLGLYDEYGEYLTDDQIIGQGWMRMYDDRIFEVIHLNEETARKILDHVLTVGLQENENIKIFKRGGDYLFNGPISEMEIKYASLSYREMMKKGRVYEKATIQTSDIPDEVKAEIEKIQKSIPQDMINHDMDSDDGWIENGMQKKFHITVLYGIDDGDADKVSGIAGKHSGIEMETDALDQFDSKEDGVVLVLRCKSNAMEKLHKDLRKNIDNKHSYKDYKPHLTVCYLNEKMEDLPEVKKVKWPIESIEISKSDGEVEEIAIGNEAAAFLSFREMLKKSRADNPILNQLKELPEKDRDDAIKSIERKVRDMWESGDTERGDSLDALLNDAIEFMQEEDESYEEPEGEITTEMASTDLDDYLAKSYNDYMTTQVFGGDEDAFVDNIRGNLFDAYPKEKAKIDAMGKEELLGLAKDAYESKAKYRQKRKVASLSYREKIARGGIVELARKFFLQEAQYGTVDEDVLDDLQAELLVEWHFIYKELKARDRIANSPKGKKMQEDKDYERLDNWISSELGNKGYAFFGPQYTAEEAEAVISNLKQSKSKRERILAINDALHQEHLNGNMLGKDYDEMRWQIQNQAKTSLSCREMKKAALDYGQMNGIYVDPEGNEYPVEGDHAEWINSRKNQAVIGKYIDINGIAKKFRGNIDNIWNAATVALNKKGWMSFSFRAYPEEINVNIGNASQLGSLEDWLIAKAPPNCRVFIYIVDDTQFDTEWPLPAGETLKEVYEHEKKKQSMGIQGASLSYREMKKQAKLNINMVRRFYEQESKRGVVDDKILDELLVDLVQTYSILYETQKKFFWLMATKKYNSMYNQDPYTAEEWADNRLLDSFPQYDLLKTPGFIASMTFPPAQALEILNRLENAKTDKQKILAINEALNQAHDAGNILGDEYDALREEMEGYSKKGALSYREMLKTALGPGDFYGFYALSLIPPSYWKDNPYAASKVAELLNTMFKAYAPKVEFGITGEIYNAYQRHAVDYNDYLDVAQKKNWEHAEVIFNDVDTWKGVLKGYGGKKWAGITRLYIEMKEKFPIKSDELPQGFILIDQLHDIEHNTSALLAEHYDWMEDALDFKAEAEPHEIAAKADDFYRHIVSESGVLGEIPLTHREAALLVESDVANKAQYVSNCTDSFDDKGNCRFDFFVDVSDFANKLEKFDECVEEGGDPYLTKEEFDSSADVPRWLEDKAKGHGIQYFYLDLDNGRRLFVLYDSDSDMHYFFA